MGQRFRCNSRSRGRGLPASELQLLEAMTQFWGNFPALALREISQAVSHHLGKARRGEPAARLRASKFDQQSYLSSTQFDYYMSDA